MRRIGQEQIPSCDVAFQLGAIRISMPTFKSLDPKRNHLYLIDNNEEEGALMTLKFVQVREISWCLNCST